MRRANVEVRRHTLIYRCSGGDAPMAYWLFQGNPSATAFWMAFETLPRCPGWVTRYAKEMQPGDGVLVWIR